MKQLLLVLAASICLSSCGIGGYQMNGVSGKERTEYLKSIKPYGAHWVKDGMTEEQRLDDIQQCGGGRGLYVGFPDAQIKAEKRLEESNDFPARNRLSKAWSECMQVKGYRYQK